MAQIVYYFTTAIALGGPDRKISFTVPTGNFGDIFAGYAAKRMGLPIGKLVIATNENDILARTLKTGRYDMKEVKATTSPSMDIQISSNFERLLFEAYDRDASKVRACHGQPEAVERLRDRAEGACRRSRRISAPAAPARSKWRETIKNTYAETGYLLDPHSAIGVFVAAKHEKPNAPMVTLATAHPAKFPAAVKSASGIDPALPTWLADLMHKEERFQVIDPELKAVESFIGKHART